MGNKVTVVSSSERKREYVEKKLGVSFINSGRTAETRKEMTSKYSNIFDLIICTAPILDDVGAYLQLVKTNGTFCLVGIPAKPLSFHAFQIIAQRKKVVGSCIGGIKETQEMLNFCAEHKLWSEVEIIKASEVNRAYQELGTFTAAKQRFVIDVKNSLTDGDWEVDMEPVKETAPHTVHPHVEIVGAENTSGKTYYPDKDVFE